MFNEKDEIKKEWKWIKEEDWKFDVFDEDGNQIIRDGKSIK